MHPRDRARVNPERPHEESTYFAFLVRAGEILSTSLDYRETLQNVCRAAVETVADICLLDIGRPGETELAAAAHREPSEEPHLRGAGDFLRSEPERPEHPVCTVIKTGETMFVHRVDEDFIDKAASSDSHAAFFRKMRIRSMIIVPVSNQAWGIVGALTLARTDDGQPFNDIAVRFAQDLGRRCGIAIAKARYHSQIADVSTRYQKLSLPNKLPRTPCAHFSAYYEPADKTMFVGGDWYDAFPLPNGKIALSVGDISGHGLEAAAHMGYTRVALRAALAVEADVAKALDVVDYMFRYSERGDFFATASVAIFDPKSMTMTCESAGHPGPLIWEERRNGVIDPFRERGLPLGFRDMAGPQEPAVISVSPGTLAVFFTDGLVEWDHDYNAGERAAYRAIEDRNVREAENPAESIVRAVVKGKHHDDVAVMTLNVLEDGQSSSEMR